MASGKKSLQPASSAPGSNGGELPFPVELPSDTSFRIATTLKKQWKRYRKALRTCQKDFSRKSVHASRVQTRRLMSTLELLTPFLKEREARKARQDLKKHLNCFDDLRDTQVQLQAIRPLRREYPAAKAFADYLKKRAIRFERLAQNRVWKLRTKRLAELTASFRSAVNLCAETRDPAQFNRRLLRGVDLSFRRTVRLALAIDPTDAATIHQTRVAFKSFRYMVELLTELGPPDARARLAALQEYQRLMGDIQDAEMMLQAWDRYRQKKQLLGTPADELTAELRRRRLMTIQIFLRHLNRLYGFWGPTGIRRASSPLTHKIPSHATGIMDGSVSAKLHSDSKRTTP
jgi:CHAD domain-containing protein